MAGGLHSRGIRRMLPDLSTLVMGMEAFHPRLRLLVYTQFVGCHYALEVNPQPGRCG